MNKRFKCLDAKQQTSPEKTNLSFTPHSDFYMLFSMFQKKAMRKNAKLKTKEGAMKRKLA